MKQSFCLTIAVALACAALPGQVIAQKPATTGLPFAQTKANPQATGALTLAAAQDAAQRRLNALAFAQSKAAPQAQAALLMAIESGGRK